MSMTPRASKVITLVVNVAGLIVGFAILGTVFFVTQYFQAVQGYTALESGLRTLPTTMGIFLVAPFAGMLAVLALEEWSVLVSIGSAYSMVRTPCVSLCC